MTHSRTSSTLSIRSDSSQSELTLWRKALDQFDFGEFKEALESFSTMEPRAKVFYNMAMCSLNIGDRHSAADLLNKSLALDPYLAISSFQLGCLQRECNYCDESIKSFQLCKKAMRDLDEIDYGRLGPDLILLASDVYLNLGITLKGVSQENDAVTNLLSSWDKKRTNQEDEIIQAFQGKGTIKWLTSKEIFRPSVVRLQALDPQDYLGAALVVAVGKNADHGGRIHVKCCMNDEFRLLSIEVADIRILRQAVINKFALTSKKFHIKYRDEAGDMIVICDNDDLNRAIRGRFLRIFAVSIEDQ